MATSTVIYPAAFLDEPRRCNRCGHLNDWHRTGDGSCTYEIIDEANSAWMRCGCTGWMA